MLKDKLIYVFDILKNYQRPTRMIIWVIIISISYLACFFGKIKGTIDPIAETMLLGMYTDLGVYGVSRTVEKITQAKIDGVNTSVTQLSNTNNIDAKADVHVDSAG